MVAGVCLAVFLKKRRFKLEFSYLVLATIALGFLLASVAVPYLGAALDWTRVFQITLFFLAPFLVIGSISIGEAADGILRKVTRKLGFGNSALLSRSRLTRVLAIYLVFFMLLSTGSLFAFTEGYQNIALSNQVDGLYSHQTIVGATWLASNVATLPLSGKHVTIYHYVNGIPYNDTTNTTNAAGQITFNHIFSSAGSYAYYATFAGDVYNSSTSAAVNVNVGSSQSSSQAPNQAPTSVYSVAQTTTTLSVSTTTPAVGQLVTFTATLTTPQVVYVDSINFYVLGGALGLGQQAQLPFSYQNEIAGGSTLFLGTYNIQHNNNASLIHAVGVNLQSSYVNVTPLISNRSLIYSNGGASVYSYDPDVVPPLNVTALGD
jgi:uncharacterized membrane protein